MRVLLLAALLALASAKGGTYRGYGSSYSSYRGGYYGRSYSFFYFPFFYPRYHGYYDNNRYGSLQSSGVPDNSASLTSMLDDSFCRRFIGVQSTNVSRFGFVSERTCFKYKTNSIDKHLATPLPTGLMMPDAVTVFGGFTERHTPYVSYTFLPVSALVTDSAPNFTDPAVAEQMTTDYVFSARVELDSVTFEDRAASPTISYTLDFNKTAVGDLPRPAQRMIDTARVANTDVTWLVRGSSPAGDVITGALTVRWRLPSEFAEDDEGGAFLRPSAARLDFYLALDQKEIKASDVKVGFTVFSSPNYLQSASPRDLALPKTSAVKPASSTLAASSIFSAGILNPRCHPRVELGSSARTQTLQERECEVAEGMASVDNAKTLAEEAAATSPAGFVSVDPMLQLAKNEYSKWDWTSSSGNFFVTKVTEVGTYDNVATSRSYVAAMNTAPTDGVLAFGLSIGHMDPMEVRLRSPATSAVASALAAVVAAVVLFRRR